MSDDSPQYFRPARCLLSVASVTQASTPTTLSRRSSPRRTKPGTRARAQSASTRGGRSDWRLRTRRRPRWRPRRRPATRRTPLTSGSRIASRCTGCGNFDIVYSCSFLSLLGTWSSCRSGWPGDSSALPPRSSMHDSSTHGPSTDRMGRCHPRVYRCLVSREPRCCVPPSDGHLPESRSPGFLSIARADFYL